MTALLLAAALASAQTPDFNRAGRPADWLRALTDAPAPPRPSAAPAAGSSVLVSSAGAVVAEPELWDALAQKDAVCVGESHDAAAHHETQRLAIAALSARRPGLIVGLEMIEAQEQPSLDGWLSGALDDAAFEAFWTRVWGWWELYEPVLREAKSRGLPLRALNAPRPLIRQIARGGLGSLTPAQRARLPGTIAQTRDARYLGYLKKSLNEHGPLAPDAERRLLEAMAAWNETMGQNAASPGGPMLVLAGMGHCLYGAGLLESLRARRPDASTAVLLSYPFNGAPRPEAELLRELRDPASRLLEQADWFRLSAL